MPLPSRRKRICSNAASTTRVKTTRARARSIVTGSGHREEVTSHVSSPVRTFLWYLRACVTRRRNRPELRRNSSFPRLPQLFSVFYIMCCATQKSPLHRSRRHSQSRDQKFPTYSNRLQVAKSKPKELTLPYATSRRSNFQGKQLNS